MKPATAKNHLAAIHIAHKALGISADDAIALKLAVVGVASAGDMTAQQRRRYLAHLSGLQANAAVARGEKPAYTPRRAPLQRSIDDAHDARWSKARALWHALAVAGVVHTDTDAALMGWIKRQTHIEHWRFLHTWQINQVIESLKKWCAEKGVPVETQAQQEEATSCP